MTRRLLVVLFVLCACRDFDEAIELCLTNGICVTDAGAGGGGGGGGTAGGGVAGGTSTGGGGGTAGGTAGGGTAGGGTAGGGTAGGGTAGGGTAGGGTAGGGAAGGGMVNPNGWGLYASQSTLSVAPGTVVVSELEVTRPTFNFDEVELFIELPDGGPGEVQADFSSNAGIVTDTTLTVWAPFPWDGGAIPFSIGVYVEGGGALLARAQLQLVGQPPRATLLIDDDGAGTNQPPMAPPYSTEDRIFVDGLAERGISFDRFVLPYITDGGELTAPLINRYANVIWYTGDTWSGLYAFTPQNESVAAQWLDQGGKRFVLVSDAYFYSVGASSWTSTTSAFVSRYLGGRGTMYLDDSTPHRFAGPGVNVPYGTSSYYIAYLNPKPETQVLFTETIPDSGYPVVTRYVTDAGSISVFSGFNLEEIRSPDAGGTRKAVLKALLDASGIQ